MQTLARPTAPLALLLTLAVSLSACGGDDDDKADQTPDGTAQACRVVAVTDSALVGPRDAVKSGEFTAGLMASYDAAIGGLQAAVSGEGELSSEVTSAVIALAGGYSRTRAYVQERMLAGSSRTSEGSTLVTAEERLYRELVDVCPALQDSEEE